MAATKNTREWAQERLRSALGPAGYAPSVFPPPHSLRKGPESSPSRIRDYYKAEYQTVDRYDSNYYAFLPQHDQPRWQAVFMWAGFFMALQHAWAAWCEIRGERVLMKTFLGDLLDDWIRSGFDTAP